jgi:hypothetical protein
MIEYIFTLANQEEHRFTVDLERLPGSLNEAAPAFWTDLGFQQCTNCPLKTSEHQHCPTALDIEAIASRFSAIKSFERVKVEVKTPERTYIKFCDAQTGLRALLGLVMATSACPITSGLKALAYYHLPFASIDETLFRVVSAYLIKQYFVFQDGGVPDWEMVELNQFYRDLQELNACFKVRLDSASEKDANLNAVCSLNFLSIAVADSLEGQLKRLRPRFSGVPA